MQLLADGVKILHRVPSLAAGYIHNVDQKPTSVNVAQKVMSQTCTLGSALNDTGDVRHDEGHALIHIDHAQIGKQGGKMVVGNLGTGVGGDGEQGGFAHVGEAHQTHIRQQL